jgi:hypothetical protein
MGLFDEVVERGLLVMVAIEGPVGKCMFERIDGFGLEILVHKM